MNDNSEMRQLAETAAGYAGKMYNGLEKIVSDLREDRTRQGLSSLAEAIDGIEWLIRAVSGLNAEGGGYGGFDAETISGYISEMVEAAENMDYVLLADLIEYEILPIIDEWGNKLDDILGI